MLPPQDIHKPQAATFVVAASDSLHRERADYVCDGVDDQVDIRAAIDALPGEGGKVVLLDGKYYFSGVLSITKNNTELEGNQNSVIFLNDNTDTGIINASANNIILKDLAIDGNKANQSVELYVIYTATGKSNITIQNCHIYNGMGDGVCSFANNVRIVGNCIHDCYEQEVGVEKGNNILVDGNFLYNDEIHGNVAIAAYEGQPISRVNVTNNFIWNAHKSGVIVYAQGDSVENIMISGNTIYGNTEHGIHIMRGGGMTLSNVKINDNLIDGNTLDGIELQSGPHIIITNNIISNNNVVGIDSHSSSNIIQGNLITLNQQHGIYLRTSSGTQILNNFLLNNGQAADNVYDAITTWLISNSENIRIENNYILSNVDNRHKYGIGLDRTESFIMSGWYIKNNNILGSAGVAIHASAAVLWEGIVVKDNLGWITENAGSSTGTGAQQTIAHGLAKTPTKVILWNIEDGANPYQSAAADGTNIKITAVINQDYGWEAEVV